MPLQAKTRTLSMLLGLLLVTACGATQALRPPPSAIPVRQDLRLACQSLATPAEDSLPPLAPEGSEARRVQLEERAFWMEFVLTSDGVSAPLCARYLELLGLVDEHNALAREIARSWPR